MSSQVTSSDGESIVYDAVGTGPALVLVHGWSCDRSYWRNQQALADRYRVVTIDLAGHGDSAKARHQWTMAAYGEDVMAVLGELAVNEAVLVGHSMGGNACVEAARRLGDQVRGLVWVDTYARLDVPASAGSVDEFVAPFEHDFVAATRAFVREMFLPDEDPTVKEWVVNDMAAAPPHVAVASIHASLSYGRQAHRLIGGTQAPIVAINTDYLGVDAASLRSHGVAVERFRGAGHFPMLTFPERFTALLEDVVTRWLT